ncbi:hypothetical protein BCR34DRAFT_358180 [Clohesyomyces aquaticus]|uniref:Uncharacterized protein n=1 Tax=Clohesyomyces aquaticus TaxID=1231657 RepID=A0A1Y1ZIL8_9PLEO|nr:hypothetical protein BCR34DRAFT_358180 [Clohesyomyces aquaticus]
MLRVFCLSWSHCRSWAAITAHRLAALSFTPLCLIRAAVDRAHATCVETNASPIASWLRHPCPPPLAQLPYTRLRAPPTLIPLFSMFQFPFSPLSTLCFLSLFIFRFPAWLLRYRHPESPSLRRAPPRSSPSALFGPATLPRSPVRGSEWQATATSPTAPTRL